MSIDRSQLRAALHEAAAGLNVTAKVRSLGERVSKVTNDFLSSSNAVIPSSAGIGLETYGDYVPEMNRSFNAMADTDMTKLVKDLSGLGLSDRHTMQAAEDILVMLDQKSYNPADILRNNHTASGNVVALSKVIGRTAAAGTSQFIKDGAGMEAFGDDINRLNTDQRLNMSLIIMRPYDNIMDKGLARVSQTSPIVTIRVPAPEAWDWATSQDAANTAARFSNTYSLRNLYRNPTPVNSAAKKIVARTANDTNSVLWNSTTEFYKTNAEINLIDLAKNSAAFGYAHSDRTDLIADGGIVDNLIVKIVKGGGSPATEYFKLPTRTFDLAQFVISPSNKTSGQRQVIMECVLPISATTKQFDGSDSVIAAALTDAKLKVTFHATVSLDIQKGTMRAGGSVDLELVQLADGTTISGGTNTLFGLLTSSFEAYSADLYFDEENQRKANMSVWVQYHEQQFVVPRSRIYFTEYALTQDVDENAVAATSSIVALGNGRRGLDIIVNALGDVADAGSFAAANPEIAGSNTASEQSFAASLVKPTVVTATLDFETEELNAMNESTRLTEIHGRFRARFLAMATMMMAKSLMLNQYKGGEKPVFKCWVHSSIADIVIGILDYHPTLNDTTGIATGADYSMVLPNGYRLDVIKSNFDCLQNRIYAVPVIESDMGGILSAASIRDCGSVTTNYSPTNNGSVVRRVATTTREIVMMSNKVGLCLEVKGLEAQLGDIGFTKIALNADYSESMDI